MIRVSHHNVISLPGGVRSQCVFAEFVFVVSVFLNEFCKRRLMRDGLEESDWSDWSEGVGGYGGVGVCEDRDEIFIPNILGIIFTCNMYNEING